MSLLHSHKSLLNLFWQVSWLTLGLGLILEMLAFTFDALLGQADGLASFAVDLVKKVLWSLPLCLVLVSVLQRSLNMGVAGLLAAPVFTLFSSLLDSQIREVFLAAATEPLSLTSIKLAMFRGLEYGLLGLLLGGLFEQRRNTIFNHVLSGLAVGVLFGTLLVIPQWGQIQNASWPLLNLMAQNLGELIFPVGCSLIIKLTTHTSDVSAT